VRTSREEKKDEREGWREDIAPTFLPKEELPVEVRKLDGIQIDDVDLLHTRQGQVLQDLAAQPPSTHHQHTRL